MKIKDKRFQGFYEGLKKTIDSDKGKHKDLIKYCPSFFKLLCNILNDKLVDWNTKMMINAALAYFVIPEDIIPDEEEGGYVDDLFIVSYVLKEIKTNVSKDLIEANWEEEGDILSLIEDIYIKSKSIVSNHTIDILRKVGLQKYQNLDLAEYSGEYPQKIARLANEKRELLGLLTFLVKQLYRANLRGRKVGEIKKFLQNQADYDEINRLIELSKINHNYSPSRKENDNRGSHSEIESRLEAARMRALMEDSLEEEDQ